VFPEVTLFEMVPMLRLIGSNGPQLVNARQFLNVVIVDQLVARGELRVGLGEHAETVTITPGQLETTACAGDPRCPGWPSASSGLAPRPAPDIPRSSDSGTGTMTGSGSLRHPATYETSPPGAPTASPPPDQGRPGGNPRPEPPAGGQP